MQNIVSAIKNRKGWKADIFGVFVFFVVYMAWFLWLERHAVPRYVIHTPLDDRLPFWEVFVVPYYAWFVFVPAVLVYFFVFSPEDFRKTAFFLGIGMIGCLVVYTFWPNMQELRPAVMPRDNFFSRWVAALYRMDTPTNVCPSIHVLNTIGLQIGLFHCSRLQGRRGVLAATSVLSVLIILSTLFIKQHSAVDAFWSVLAAALLYLLIYRLDLPVRLFRASRSE